MSEKQLLIDARAVREEMRHIQTHIAYLLEEFHTRFGLSVTQIDVTDRRQHTGGSAFYVVELTVKVS